MRDDQFFNLINSTEEIMVVFRSLGIIRDQKACPKCKKMLTKRKKKSEKLGMVWYCKYCKKSYSILIDSEFYNLRFDFRMILKFTFYYFQRNNFSHEYILNNCGISEEGFTTLLSLFRRKIREYIENNPVRLGGPFKEIQIDESHWAKRKYGLGRIGEAVWIFGMIEVKSNICYLQKVQFRDAATLVPIVQSKCADLSYIISDQWAAYNSLKEKNYFRDTVCHKKNFVDPISRANTQKIENLWVHLKKIKHYSYGIKLDSIDDHLATFMFFWNYRHIELADFIGIIFNK